MYVLTVLGLFPSRTIQWRDSQKIQTCVKTVRDEKSKSPTLWQCASADYIKISPPLWCCCLLSFFAAIITVCYNGGGAAVAWTTRRESILFKKVPLERKFFAAGPLAVLDRDREGSSSPPMGDAVPLEYKERSLVLSPWTRVFGPSGGRFGRGSRFRGSV